jgi:hypothetical protein
MAANAGGNTKRMTVDVHTSKSIEHSKVVSSQKLMIVRDMNSLPEIG